jgi:hypothetical protein
VLGTPPAELVDALVLWGPPGGTASRNLGRDLPPPHAERLVEVQTGSRSVVPPALLRAETDRQGAHHHPQVEPVG